MKYCPTSTVVWNPGSVQNWITLKCIDNFPPPLLLSIPRDNGLAERKSGCPLSPNFIIINSDSVPFSLWSFVVSRIPLLFWSKLEEWPRSCWKSFCKHRHKRGISNAFLFIVFNSQFDVIKHRHEDNSSLELIWVAHFGHELLDFVAELQCGESWDNIPL